MIPSPLEELITRECERFSSHEKLSFFMPAYNPNTYYSDVTSHPYFDALMTVRHVVQAMSHHYFSHVQNARNVDLFMLTPSVSSPMGPGSDSEPIDIEFGGHKTFLVDSSQFGFEPLLFQGGTMAYCYLPSMRGEDPDDRHLNQFYHCECEMIGTMEELLPIAEDYVRHLAASMQALGPIIERISDSPNASMRALELCKEQASFPRMTFADAVNLLAKEDDFTSLVRVTEHGRDITAEGEARLASLLVHERPFWITHYDRDRVPFYQKPSDENPNVTLNADLIVPPLASEGFGGEIAGLGQRQDRAEQMYESLKRQHNISAEPYEWYIDLRRNTGYRPTSGFGLGIERFIAWALAKPSIRDVALYPRQKGVKSYP